MLRLFDLLEPEGGTTAGLDDWMKEAVSDCPPFQLLQAATWWLNGFDDDTLYGIISFNDLGAVSRRAEAVAATLTFGEMTRLQKTHMSGFRRLLSLEAFLPAVVRLEKRGKAVIQM